MNTTLSTQLVSLTLAALMTVGMLSTVNVMAGMEVRLNAPLAAELMATAPGAAPRA